MRRHETMPDESRLDEIIADYLAAEESGDPPDRQALLASHSDFAEQLRAFFDDQDQMSALLSDDADRQPPARVGQVGDYELLEEIARGGMGAVYKARQKSLNRTVALKMLLGGTLADEDDLKRFRAEAEAAGNLQHSGIVTVHEVGVHDGLHYFSMDFIEGRSLAELTHEDTLSPHRAARYVKQIAEAVHFAHQEGILHRDLKPSNVLVDSSDRAQITDFGLTRSVQGDSSLTRTGQIVGTPQYMAPEQAQAKHGLVGPASDIYAIGGILYELLTGRAPFRADTAIALLQQVVEREPPSPRLLNPAIPKDLETICLKCLAKEPHKRYATAQHLADDLERYLGGQPIHARPLGPIARLWRSCRRKPVVASLAASVGLLVTATAIVASLAAVHFETQRDTLLSQRERLRAREGQLSATNGELQAALRRSYFQQAQASRWSGRPGQRLTSLEALGEAARIRPSQNLRNEAVAAMALADIKLVKELEVAGGTRLAVDADLQLFAEKAETSKVIIRSMTDGREIRRLPNVGWPVHLQFDPSGRLLAASLPDAVHVWDLQDGRQILDAPCASGHAKAVDFGPRGRYLAVVAPGADKESEDDRSVVIYDLQDPEAIECETVNLKPTTAEPIRAVWLRSNRDGLTILCGDDVELWDYAEKSKRESLRFDYPPYSCDVSPDGKLLAVSCYHDVYVLDIHRGKPGSSAVKYVVEEHLQRGLKTAFQPSGEMLVSSGWDGTTRFWCAASGRKLLQTKGSFCGFDTDGEHVVLRRGTTLQLWRVATAEEYRTVLMPSAESNQRAAAFSDDGRLMATAGRYGVRLWDATGFKELAHLPISQTCWVQFHPATGDLYSSGIAGVLKWPLRWKPGKQLTIELGPPQKALVGSNVVPRQACFDDDGDTMVVDFDQSQLAAIFHRRNRSSPKPIIIESGNNHSVSISPDGRWAATGTWHGTKARVWDTRTGECVETLETNGHTDVQFSPDGRWLVTSVGGEFRFYRVGSWQLDHVIGERTHGIPAPIAWSPQSAVAAVGLNRCGARLVDPETGRELATLTATPPRRYGRGTRFQFSPDGAHLVLLGKGIHVWDLRKVRRQLQRMELDWDSPPLPPRGETGPSPQVDVLGRNRLEELRLDGEVAWYRTLIASQHETVGLHNSLGLALRQQGQLNAAIEHFRAALGLDPGSQTARNNLVAAHKTFGATLDERGDWEAAIAEYRNVLRLDSEEASVRNRLAAMQSIRAWRLSTSAEIANRDPEEALAAAQEAVELRPDVANHWDNLGVAQYRTGDYEAAVASLERARAMREGEDPYHAFFLAMAYWQAGQRDRALEIYAKAAHWFDNKPRTGEQRRFRKEAEQLLDADRAISAYLSRLEAEPETASWYAARGSVRARFGRPGQAADDFAEALARLTDDQPSAERRTLLRSIAARPGVFHHVLEKQPQWAGDLWLERGRYQIRRERWDQALACYAQILQPSAPGSHWFECASLLLLVGDDKGYAQLCRHLHDRWGDTDRAHTAYRLAGACTLDPCAGIHPEQLLRWAKKAVADQRNKFTLRCLAAASFRAERFEQAVALLEEAKGDHGGVASNLAFPLALAHHRLGHEEQARQWYERGLAAFNQARPQHVDDPAPWALSHWLNVNVWHREAKAVLEPPTPVAAPAPERDRPVVAPNPHASDPVDD